MNERSVGIPEVRISELLAHSNHFKGKRVAVTGYYYSGFEDSVLYEHPDDRTRFVDDWPGIIKPFRGLWIEPDVRPGFQQNVQFIKQGRVRIIGTFMVPKSGGSDFGLYPGELIKLEEFRPAP